MKDKIIYRIDGKEVDKLEFDTSINETITDYVYREAIDLEGSELDEEIDNIYETSMKALKGIGQVYVDGVKFEMVVNNG